MTAALAQSAMPIPFGDGFYSPRPGERLIRLREVMYLTGLAKATIYKKVALRQFPLPVKIGPRFTAWLESDIQRYIAELKAEA